MTANVNPETGISFGVVAAQNCPDLHEEILQNGVDNRFQAWREETEERLNSCESQEDLVEVLKYLGREEWSEVFEYEEDWDYEEALDRLSEEWECDEPSITYQADGYSYWLTSLGGAHVIYVLSSPYVATCRPCSPCCPNAGDLDNVTEPNGGMIAYFVNPEEYKPGWEDRPVFDLDDETDPVTVSLMQVP
jgi:hypothetical protein